MPRRTQIKPTRRAGAKTIAQKTKTMSASQKVHRKDLRFSISLVILIGMLVFSMLLLLVSLNKSLVASAETKTYTVNPRPIASNTSLNKASNDLLNDSSLDFKITVPSQLGEWFYKIGEVKSLTDKSLSDQYLQIYVPLAGVKSNNFDVQNKNILTIRKFSKKEWVNTGTDCPDGDICKAAGEMLAKSTDSNGDEWVYAYNKPTDCPKSIEAKCSLADKIIESFQLK